VKPEEETCGWH